MNDVYHRRISKHQNKASTARSFIHSFITTLATQRYATCYLRIAPCWVELTLQRHRLDVIRVLCLHTVRETDYWAKELFGVISS